MVELGDHVIGQIGTTQMHKGLEWVMEGIEGNDHIGLYRRRCRGMAICEVFFCL